VRCGYSTYTCAVDDLGARRPCLLVQLGDGVAHIGHDLARDVDVVRPRDGARLQHRPRVDGKGPRCGEDHARARDHLTDRVRLVAGRIGCGCDGVRNFVPSRRAAGGGKAGELGHDLLQRLGPPPGDSPAKLGRRVLREVLAHEAASEAGGAPDDDVVIARRHFVLGESFGGAMRGIRGKPAM
jgi:hypothetical protein